MNILSNRLFLFSLAVSLGLVVGHIRKWNRRRRISALMKNRKSANNSFLDHFRHIRNPAIAQEIGDMLQRRLHTDISNLHPVDRFGVELGFSEAGESELLEFIYAIEEHYDIMLPPANRCMKMTFKDFVEIVDKEYSLTSSIQKENTEEK